MRAFFLRRLLVLHKKWFCECEVERPSSSRPGWGHKGPEILWDSAMPLHWHRKLEADVVFWEFCFIGVFVLFSQAASTEHIRLDGGGRLYLEVSEESMSSFGLWLRICQGHGSVGSSVLIRQPVFLPKRKLFWSCGRMAFGEKGNQRKMGRLGISFTDSQSRE